MEDKYFIMLQQALPKSELRLTRDTAHAMDILVINDKQAPVLIDIKCYTRNVGCDEIKKFHDDMLSNASHGILVSAETGVACKNHMQVDEELDEEVRRRIKNLEEGTSTWEVEYGKVLDQIKRNRGLDQ